MGETYTVIGAFALGVSNAIESGPQLFIQKGPLSWREFSAVIGMTKWTGSGAVLEAPAFVAGLDDIAVMGKAVEQRGRHLRIAKDARPFAESQARADSS